MTSHQSHQPPSVDPSRQPGDPRCLAVLILPARQRRPFLGGRVAPQAMWSRGPGNAHVFSGRDDPK